MEPKNKSAEDDFMDSLNTGEENPLEPLADDLFPEEKSTEVIEEKPAKVDYSKDEKLQRYIDKQVEKRVRSVQPTATETFKESIGDPDLVNAFKTIIGDDTPEKIAALKALEHSLSRVDERATAKAVERLQQVQQEQAERETQELQEAESELEEGRSDIEDHIGTELTDRQWDAYKDFLVKIEPKGGYDEYPDFVETFEVFRNSYKRSNSQAKALASRGLERSSSAETAPKLGTDKGSLWQQVDRIFESRN